jgi:Glycosyl transferase family 90
MTTEIIRSLEGIREVWKGGGVWEETCKYLWEVKAHVYISLIKEGKIDRWIFFGPLGLPEGVDLGVRGGEGKSELRGGAVHLMGGIVQTDKGGEDDGGFQVYYAYIKRVLEAWGSEIPDGPYIWSLSDAVWVPSESWPKGSVFGGVKVPREISPILGVSGRRGFRDVVIPCYDDVSLAKHELGDLRGIIVTWGGKREGVVFRGGATGKGGKANQRVAISNMVRGWKREGRRGAELFDFALTGGGSKYKLDEGWNRVLVTGGVVIEPKRRLTSVQESRFKWILHIEGNVAAYRLGKNLLYGSCVLKVESQYFVWLEYYLVPWVHFVPVKEDLSDLWEKVMWCKAHDSECREIAAKGRELALRLLKIEKVREFFASQMKMAAGEK